MRAPARVDIERVWVGLVGFERGEDMIMDLGLPLVVGTVAEGEAALAKGLLRFCIVFAMVCCSMWLALRAGGRRECQH